ncbi:hypothetical protein EGT74_24550 [Chitinophaga lutea]|uniref:Uncharacterized protein n=1 Tax=Chitinophaga lutea TaxID=2488634 RepID=A0A3N4PML8_9BACT|nr:hypothetical protein [Chitinophaga lutea]RPE05557.1 hypothetical protein EGT74_24550 [Chitinophaga lutea]
MSVEIDGSLAWTANLDFSDIEKEIAALENRLLAVNKSASEAFAGTGKKVDAIFNPANIQQFGSAAEAAVKSLSRAAELLQDTFGAEKLEKLDEELQKATNHAEEFGVILNFIQENAKDLSVGDPEATAQVEQSINAIRESVQGASAAVEQFDEKFESATATAGTLYGQIQNLENEIVEIERLMEASNDKTELSKLNDQSRELNAQLDSMKARFQSLRDSNFGKVGAAPAAINLDTASKKELKGNLQELTAYAEKLKQALSFSDTDAATQKYNKALADTKARIDEVNARLGQTDEKVVKVSTRLELVRNLLASMKPSDEGYQKLLDEAIQLENRFKNVNRTVALLGSNTAGVQALKQGINGLVGGFGAAASAMALFSGEEDRMQQTMTKLFLVIQVVAGAEQFLTTVNKESAVVQYALNLAKKAGFVTTVGQTAAATTLAAAEGAQAVAAEGAAVAQWNLNAAMAANPVGAMLVALSAVAGAIALYIANTDSALEVQTKMNEALAAANKLYGELVELQAQVYSDRSRVANETASLAQAEGKSNREILELQIKANQAARLEAVYKLESLGYDRQRIGIERAKLESIIQQRMYLESIPNDRISKEQKQQLDNLKSQEAVVKSLFDSAVGYFNAIQAANEKDKELRAQQAKENRERAITSVTAEAEARAIAARKGSKEELELQINAINARRRQELADVNITSGERAKINAQAEKDIENLRREIRQRRLTDEQSLIKATLALAKEGSIEEFNAKLSLIQLEARAKQDQEGVTSAKIREIKAEELREIAELNRKYTFDRSETDIAREISNINERLAVVRSGSAEEVELKRDAIIQQQSLEIAKAKATILNEQNLAIRLKEIHTKSIADRKKLDEDYADRVLSSWMDKIKRDTDGINQGLEKVLNNPTSTANEKFEAQRQILENNRKALKDMISLVERFAKSGSGNVDELNKLLNKLNAELRETNDAIELNNVEKFLSIVGQIGETLATASGSLRSFAGDLKGINDGLADTLETLSDMIDGFGGIVQLGASLGGSFKNGKFDAKAASGKATNIGGFIGAGASIGAAVGSIIPALGTAVGGVVGAVVGAVVGGVAAAFKGGKKVRESLQKTFAAQYEFIVNQELGEYRINEVIRQRVLLKAQEIKLTLQALKAQKEAAAETLKQNKSEQERILQLLQAESFNSGVGTRKRGGFLGLWRKKESVDQYSSLLGMTVSDIEKLYASGQLDGRAKALFEQLQRLQSEGQNIQQMLADLEQQTKEVFTGTTAESITDSIVDGFANGKFAAQDFAGDFEDLMRQAALNALKFQYLEEPLQAFYEEFAKAAESDNVLTQSEMKTLQDKYNAIIKAAGLQFKQIEDITGIDLSNGSKDDNSLKGAIRGITEQQAELLAGQFGGLRLTNMQQLEIMNQNLGVLNRIKEDTSNLSDIRASLRNINTVGVKIIK